MVLRSKMTDWNGELSTEDQINEIYIKNNLTKDSFVSLVSHGSEVIVTWDDEI